MDGAIVGLAVKKSETLCLLLAGVVWMGGCGADTKFATEERLDRGLVVILPGIEGRSEANENIRRGLVAAGVGSALPIYSWGRPIPIAGVLLNQVDVLGNYIAGGNIARFISEYQDRHPGMPVYIVGHSGGGGVAVFAAEAMPEDRKLDGLILLSASISRSYDLTKALSRCRSGIVNFYNPDDALLGAGTIIMGNVDGGREPSAGRDRFTKPFPGLYQVRVDSSLSGDDAHFAATRPSFVSTRVAPWVSERAWPAGTFVTAPAPPFVTVLAAAQR